MTYRITIILLGFFLCFSEFETQAQTKETCYVTAQTLNLRSGPGSNYSVVKRLSSGAKLDVVLKGQNGWWRVSHYGQEGYVSSNYVSTRGNTANSSAAAGWKSTNYRSGSTPDCVNITPQYDYSLDNYLRVKIGNNTDVVVKLMKQGAYNDECIRVLYVRSGETYNIKNIPEGRYYLKIAYGKDYRQKIIQGKCYLKFMKNALYEKGVQTLDFYKQKMPNKVIGNDVYENWNLPSYELSLDVYTTYGEDTFNSGDISEEEFNN